MSGFNYRFDMGFNGVENSIPLSTPSRPAYSGDNPIVLFRRSGAEPFAIGTAVSNLNNTVNSNNNYSFTNTGGFRFMDSYDIDTTGHVETVTTTEFPSGASGSFDDSFRDGGFA